MIGVLDITPMDGGAVHWVRVDVQGASLELGWTEGPYGTACDFATKAPIDWDRTGFIEGDENVPSFSCEGSPSPGVSELNYVGNVCGGGTNRGTEYDWLSAWWDLRTDDGVPFDDIVDMWALARPDNWNETDTDTTAFPVEPGVRMRADSVERRGSVATAQTVGPKPSPAGRVGWGASINQIRPCARAGRIWFPADRMSDAGQLVLGASPNAYDMNASVHGTDE